MERETAEVYEKGGNPVDLEGITRTRANFHTVMRITHPSTYQM